MKLSPAQTKLLDRVIAADAKGQRFGLHNSQFASAVVLLREGLVVDCTKATDFTQFLSLPTTNL